MKFLQKNVFSISFQNKSVLDICCKYKSVKILKRNIKKWKKGMKTHAVYIYSLMSDTQKEKYRYYKLEIRFHVEYFWLILLINRIFTRIGMNMTSQMRLLKEMCINRRNWSWQWRVHYRRTDNDSGIVGGAQRRVESHAPVGQADRARSSFHLSLGSFVHVWLVLYTQTSSRLVAAARWKLLKRHRSSSYPRIIIVLDSFMLLLARARAPGRSRIMAGSPAQRYV